MSPGASFRPCHRSQTRSLVRSDQSVLKWNARVLRTGSAQNGLRRSDSLSFPAPVGKNARIWRILEGKNI